MVTGRAGYSSPLAGEIANADADTTARTHLGASQKSDQFSASCARESTRHLMNLIRVEVLDRRFSLDDAFSEIEILKVGQTGHI